MRLGVRTRLSKGGAFLSSGGILGGHCLAKRRVSSRQKNFPSFLVRGFFLFLAHSPHILFFSPLGAVRGLGQPSNLQQISEVSRAPKLVSLSCLWQQWSSFFGVLRALSSARITFLWGGAPGLSYFARALSWFSWRSSFLAWRLYLSPGPSLSLGSSSCLLLFSTSGFRRAETCGRPLVPVLGVGDFSSSWGGWAYVYSSVVSKRLQLFFLGVAAQLAL